MRVKIDKDGKPTFDGQTHPYKIGDIIEVTRDGVTVDAIVSKVTQDILEYAEVIRDKEKTDDGEHERVLAMLSLKFKEKTND